MPQHFGRKIAPPVPATFPASRPAKPIQFPDIQQWTLIGAFALLAFVAIGLFAKPPDYDSSVHWTLRQETADPYERKPGMGVHDDQPVPMLIALPAVPKPREEFFGAPPAR